MAHSTRKLGMMFTTAAWILAFVLLALVFSKILDSQNNPNQSVSTLDTGEFKEIVLKRSRNGHYVFDGEVNHRRVTFLVDTGATTTAIPGGLQQELGLTAGPAMSVSTANGKTTAYLTRLDQIAVGGIELYDVTDTASPEHLATIDPPPTADANINGVWTTAHNFEVGEQYL